MADFRLEAVAVFIGVCNCQCAGSVQPDFLPTEHRCLHQARRTTPARPKTLCIMWSSTKSRRVAIPVFGGSIVRVIIVTEGNRQSFSKTSPPTNCLGTEWAQDGHKMGTRNFPTIVSTIAVRNRPCPSLKGNDHCRKLARHDVGTQPANNKQRNRLIFKDFGAPETIRTSDPCLRRAVLYPTELQALLVKLYDGGYSSFYHRARR